MISVWHFHRQNGDQSQEPSFASAELGLAEQCVDERGVLAKEHIFALALAFVREREDSIGGERLVEPLVGRTRSYPLGFTIGSR